MRNGRIFGAMGAVAGAALALAPTIAFAKQIHVPETNPKISMTVPDDWAVTYTDVGVELEAPAKDSLVVANLLKHDTTHVDRWRSRVLAVMERHGVTVGASAAAGADKTPTPATTAAAPSTSAAAPAAGGTPNLAMPGTADQPSFAFAGGPSVETPKLPTGMQPLEATHGALDTATTPSMAQPAPSAHGPMKVNGMQIRSYRLEGGAFHGKPTDMQLVLFVLPKDEYFAVEQQSASEDNRAAEILTSVKAVP